MNKGLSTMHDGERKAIAVFEEKLENHSSIRIRTLIQGNNFTSSVNSSNSNPVPASQSLTQSFAIAAASQTITLYNASLNTLPTTQGWLFSSLPSGITPTAANGVTNLNTFANSLSYAGFARADQVLDRTIGYTLNFTAQVLAEAREASANKNNDGKDDRAGFSVIVLSSDKKGIELGFFSNSVWAQNDGANLFTQAESVAFNTSVNPVNYQLSIQGNTYILKATNAVTNATATLSGRVRDYTPFVGTIDPYETPNLIFLGDDTTSARANVNIGSISLVLGDITAPLAPKISGYTSTSIIGSTEAGAKIQLSTSSSSPTSFATPTAIADANGNFTIPISSLAGSTNGKTYYLYSQDAAGNLSTASSQRLVMGTSGNDTFIGSGGNASDLLVGGSGTLDTAQYAIAADGISIAKTGQISSATGTINIRSANIDVLTGMEQIQFTGTGYTGLGTSANQLNSIIQSSLGNNSIAEFTGSYNSSSGVFTFGAATPNATLVTFDANPGISTNYEAFLLLNKTSISGNLSLIGTTVALNGL
ncbi:Ig-like domain-containing protein [Tumidithrix elongata RA019]|uniref:Ig-like domain-containing protein n=1 Tax=Tumidithrix elongata BACA0141 TaxID=2716417 RepID=A0AAW9PTS4_9CYAN|nr:Ig-like domain-containing protein [Tumidithrix elongata RA019]